MIQWRVRHETWRLVNLYEPRFSLFVEKDVDSEDLKAQLVLYVLRFRCFLDVRNVVVPGDHCFNGKFFEELPAFLTRNHFWVFLTGKVYRTED